MNSNRTQKLLSKGLLLAILASAAGCASMQPPTEQLNTAEEKVIAARAEGAEKHAYMALIRAEQKLEDAQTAFAQEDYEAAKRYAEQAAIDARVARTEASTVKLKSRLNAVNQSIQQLQEELNKKS